MTERVVSAAKGKDIVRVRVVFEDVITSTKKVQQSLPCWLWYTSNWTEKGLIALAPKQSLGTAGIMTNVEEALALSVLAVPFLLLKIFLYFNRLLGNNGDT